MGLSANERHNRRVRDIAQAMQNRGNYDSIECFVDYEKGECDILATVGKREVYFEYKTRETNGGVATAYNQLLRWSQHRSEEEPEGTYYGVYISPNKVKIICKNGRLRANSGFPPLI